MRAWYNTLVCATLLSLAGCGGDPAAEMVAAQGDADLIITNARIYTGGDSPAIVGAMAIGNGKVLAIGTADEVGLRASQNATVLDLNGRFVMPGINDAHSHPIMGAMQTLYSCNFFFTDTPEQIQNALTACVAAQADAEWVMGGRWGSDLFEIHAFDSPRGFLDQISNKPISLVDDTGHNLWVNSAVLARLGIDENTPDPDNGRIVRDENGVPNGVLLETAAKLVRDVMPPPTPAQQVAAAEEAARLYNSLGMTGFKDAGAYDEAVAGFVGANAKGKLTAHVAVSQRTPYGPRAEPLSLSMLDEMMAIRDTHDAANLHFNTIKIFLDGVPTTARTAAMLAPYVEDDVHDEHFDGGPVHVPLDVLKQDLVEIDRRGFRIKLHTAGDRSVRIALDAIEHMRSVNGMNERAPELAHAGFIDPADIPRFKALNVAADISPQIWNPSSVIDSVIAALGDRGQAYWPNRALLDAGALVVAGSDWPSAVATPASWTGIESLVSRKNADNEAEGALWAEQAISLEEAIRIYTLNGAEALGLAGETGSLTPGMSADMIVLNHNLFEVPVEQISETTVLRTYFRGDVVYNNGDAL